MGVVDDIEDDGEFVDVAAEIGDNVAVAAAVDGEVAPPTLSVLNVPVVAASKWKDAADTPSSLSVLPSPSPSPSQTDKSPSLYQYMAMPMVGYGWWQI